MKRRAATSSPAEIIAGKNRGWRNFSTTANAVTIVLHRG
jgi:hypothetical protein